MTSNDIFNKLMNYSSSPKKEESGGNVKIKKSDRLLMNIEKQGYNMSQLEEVIRTKGNQLVVAIAGSGKTTMLIFKIAYDIVTGEATRLAEVNNNQIRVLDRIWVCTFLKSGADELKAKLALWQRRLGLMDTSESMAFSTLHAEFKRALTAMGVTTNIIDAGVNTKNLKAVTEKFAIQYENKPLNSDMLRNLESALTYTRNRLDAERYDREIYQDLNIGPSIVDMILTEWKAMRRGLGCVDFEDLQELLYEECYKKNNLDVINFLSNRYNYIYVDEFQDTSQIQYALLCVYASGAKKIVAIGDDDQTIYSWRGSCNSIITQEFAKDFNPTISKLSVNYRCPHNILKAVKPSIELNKKRFKKDIKSYNDGGLLRVGEYGSYRGMSESLSDMIYEDVKNGLSVAILCRVNSDGLLPALMLDKLGKFQYTISGDGMTLDSYIGKQVINIAKLFTEKYTNAVKSVLNQMTWNNYSVNNIMKVCKNNKVSFWEIPDEDLSYSCPDIAQKLITWKSWRRSMGDIETLKLIYQYFRTEVYQRETQYNIVCKSVISSVEAMLNFTTAETVDDFLEELEGINERLKARKKSYNGSKVRIATVHEFKGKEADSVYVWNDSENVFPTSHTDIFDEEDMEEERRVHYIACTRAKKINTIMYMKDKKSIFLKEMDLSDAELIKGKISGEIKKREKEDEAMKILRDENFFEERQEQIDLSLLDKVDKSINGISKGRDLEGLSGEDRAFVIKCYENDGMNPEEIWHELEANGYDNYSLEDIQEAIDVFNRNKMIDRRY